MHTDLVAIQWREVLLCSEEYRDSVCTNSLVKDTAYEWHIASEFKTLLNQEEKANEGADKLTADAGI